MKGTCKCLKFLIHLEVCYSHEKYELVMYSSYVCGVASSGFLLVKLFIISVLKILGQLTYLQVHRLNLL